MNLLTTYTPGLPTCNNPYKEPVLSQMSETQTYEQLLHLETNTNTFSLTDNPKIPSSFFNQTLALNCNTIAQKSVTTDIDQRSPFCLGPSLANSNVIS